MKFDAITLITAMSVWWEKFAFFNSLTFSQLRLLTAENLCGYVLIFIARCYVSDLAP